MSEITLLQDLVERLSVRVQQLELNREFKTAPIMVSERDTVADLVSLAALKFGCPEKTIYGKGKDPMATRARKWVCAEAHISRGIPLGLLGWLLGGRDHTTIHAAIYGKPAQRVAAEPAARRCPNWAHVDACPGSGSGCK